MGLTERLARFAHACPRPLLVVAPGATACRLAVERELRRRGGAPARSAAEADTLLVCGSVAASLEESAGRIWAQLPVPRARIAIRDAAAVPDALNEATDRLADSGLQRRMLAQQDEVAAAEHHDDESGDDEMSMPGGLMMADRGPDRDGLMLDQLHMQLGPVLPEWPAGLAVRVTVQGDVVQEAEVDRVPSGPDAAGPAFWDELAIRADCGEPVEPEQAARRVAAAHLDSAARLLALSGSDTGARCARRLRDELLESTTPTTELARLARRVRRSRTLRWSLAGLGPLRAENLAAGLPPMAAGDAWQRLCRWFDRAEAVLDAGVDPREGPRGPVGGKPATADVLDVLPAAITGMDLATARLTIASLDPDLDQLLDAPVRASDG